MKTSTAIIMLVLAAATLAQAPKAKPWANQWQSSFTEKLNIPVVGSDVTTGQFYYDYVNKLTRVDRANGKLDRYCGPNWYIFRSTPCNQYVVNGWRYIHFPEKKYCCKCCSAQQGCGIVKPDWFNQGEYKGKNQYLGVEVQEWDVKGMQSNVYAETTKDRIPKRIFQSPQSDMTFDHNTYSEQVDKSVFKLPQNNCETLCPALSLCGIVRRKYSE